MYHICEYGWPKMLCVSLMKDIIVIIYLFLSDIWKFAGRLSLSLASVYGKEQTTFTIFHMIGESNLHTIIMHCFIYHFSRTKFSR